jgi:hypothetical protein
MPARYRIDPERRMILSTGTGVMTDEDLRDHQRRLRSDPAFDRSFDQLWDLQEVTLVEVTSATLRELAQARSFDPGTKRAVVAPEDVVYGMARMFQTLHDEAPEELNVFRTLEEAKDWLGLG